MKAKELKTLINSLSDKQLEQELFYNSESHSISGVVACVEIAKENLYYDGEDDPSPLYTKKQLKEEQGLDSDEIAEMEPEISKGAIVINLT